MADMLMLTTMETSDSDTKTYKQAMKLLWQVVGDVCSRIHFPHRNPVVEVVHRSASYPVITSKWVFKKKRGLSGAVGPKGMFEDNMPGKAPLEGSLRVETIAKNVESPHRQGPLRI